MLFNSLLYFIFLGGVSLVYFYTAPKQRWVLLFLGSCWFYMAFIPQYILILFALILIDYFAGILIEKSEGRRRKAWLVLSLISNLGLLGIFKYFDFFSDNLQNLMLRFGFHISSQHLNLILPIGLSFHTFQSMSYTIEVYFRRFKAEKHLGLYSVYVLFFPQMVAGPIERPQHILPQLRKMYLGEDNDQFRFDPDRVLNGIRQIGWGILKKVVVADALALYVNPIYNSPSKATSLQLLIATYFFAIQIYCDFSGYSDIAIGSARILGVDLMKNFNHPYFARTIPEFWQRWHISLSTWFRDYFYIPLGGNRGSSTRWVFNILAVFLVSGFWHGANWTYLIWGGIHGVAYLFFSRVWAPFTRGLDGIGIKIIETFMTFQTVCLAWIFFRANSLADALLVCKRIFSFEGGLSNIKGPLETSDFSIAIGCIIALIAIEFLQEKFNLLESFICRPVVLRWGYYYAIIFIVIILGVVGDQQFIYFQF